MITAGDIKVQTLKDAHQPKLLRALSTWQLTSFGLTYLQPIGPAVIFGFLLTLSQGSVSIPYILAFVGMTFTIMGYSILVQEYPGAGSVYHYVKCIMGPTWGFIAGWLMALDYILIPTITAVCAALYAHQLVPRVSYESWLITFVTGMGLLNLVGIRSTAWFSSLILAVQILIVLAGFGIWMNFITHGFHHPGRLFSTVPFHTGSMSGLLQASSLAIFSFLGFDAVTTLAEEAKNPRRDIPKAMLLCTSIGFFFMFFTGYLGVLAIPEWKHLMVNQEWVDASLFHLAKMTGGESFAAIYTAGFILAMVVTNLVGTTAATRLLYGMGRDGVISNRVFGAVNKRWRTPHGGIAFIILSELILGSLVSQEQLAELINFGAIAGFIILNCSLIFLSWKFRTGKIQINSFDSGQENRILFFVKLILFPAVGLAVMLMIFLGMKTVTLFFGAAWGLIGIMHYIISAHKTPYQTKNYI